MKQNNRAKETQGKSLPLNEDIVKKHQLRFLSDCQHIGSLSGLLIRFSSLNEVYFVPALPLAEMRDRMDRGEKCVKSLSVKMAREIGLKIEIKGNFIDWVKAAEKF